VWSVLAKPGCFNTTPELNTSQRGRNQLSLQPKKARMSKSKIKTMLAYSDVKGTVIDE
jgi:hypothetical protein